MISLFDLFSIGIGPSSSHTMGPMRAAKKFADSLLAKYGKKDYQIKVHLYGSLALTGKGHAIDKAILLGLESYMPETVPVDRFITRVEEIYLTENIKLGGKQDIAFSPLRDILFFKEESLSYHANGMRFIANLPNGKEVLFQTYYSVGGGFIVEESDIYPSKQKKEKGVKAPYPYESAKALLDYCEKHQKSIDEIVFLNEKTWRKSEEIRQRLLKIWSVMDASIHRGCEKTGILPGGLEVRRRAALLYQKLKNNLASTGTLNLERNMSWLNCYALAVNEENAALGRIVTAPTNGAAGIIPAVLKYYLEFYPVEDKDEAICKFLLTAGAIGILYKKAASISGAEVGCQGEVGVACSMAAAGLAAVQGGSIWQIENAAEIGMEHHLGLTCDPIAGLVQIPCIERNAMAAVRAVNAAQLALLGDGVHKVSLDQVIATMRRTGRDMLCIYKETSLGGLAVNIPEC